MLYTARWVLPVAGPPLASGVVSVSGEHVTAITPSGELAADIDFGNAAILPGFVNAHTHLDLSGLRGQCPPQPDFTAWLRAVVAHRRSQTPERIAADIQAGIAECLACGTTLMGDILAQGNSWPLLAQSPLRAVVFLELLGLTEQRAAAALAAAKTWLNSLPESDRCRAGLSPHAPYSVRHSLFEQTSALGSAQQLPLAVHLAETRAELQLLESHTGPFQSFLERLGVWDPAALARSPDDVIARCGKGRRLFIHGNYLDASTALPPEGTVVYCPRTHAAFGHEPHPFREFLKRGVRVALGTDSLASNPDLNVLAEARFLHQRFPDVPGRDLLRMITLAGAEALGWADETGSLAPGKSADFVVLPLPDCDAADPHDLLFESDFAVRTVFFRGRETGVSHAAPLS